MEDTSQLTVLNYLAAPAAFGLAVSTSAGSDLVPATPSFFCKLVEEVVYWNTSRLPGKQYWYAFCAINAPSWKPDKMSLSLPGYQLMSPIAKMPDTLDSNAAVSTTIYSPSFISMPQSATGPSFMVKPKNGSRASQAISKFEPSLRFTIALAIRPPSPSSAEI